MSSDPWSDIKYGLEKIVSKHSQEHYKQFEECKTDYAEIQKMFMRFNVSIERLSGRITRLEKLLEEKFPESFSEEIDLD